MEEEEVKRWGWTEWFLILILVLMVLLVICAVFGQTIYDFLLQMITNPQFIPDLINKGV